MGGPYLLVCVNDKAPPRRAAGCTDNRNDCLSISACLQLQLLLLLRLWLLLPSFSFVLSHTFTPYLGCWYLTVQRNLSTSTSHSSLVILVAVCVTRPTWLGSALLRFLNFFSVLPPISAGIELTKSSDNRPTRHSSSRILSRPLCEHSGNPDKSGRRTLLRAHTTTPETALFTFGRSRTLLQFCAGSCAARVLCYQWGSGQGP